MAKYKKIFKKNFKIIFTYLILLIISLGLICYLEYDKRIALEEARINDEKSLVEKIKSNYGHYVKVNSGTIFYKKKGKKYIPIIKVNSEKDYTLTATEINKNTKYFHIEELDYYVKYQDVSKVDNLIEKNLRYKNYLPFNENIVTKDKVSLYQNNELIYELYFSLDTPIIEKEDNGYYIEYNNELYFVNSEDVANVYAKENTNAIESTSVPVTVYHFIYLEGDNSCNESICHSEAQVRSHFNYLRENNFFTLNTTELGKFIDGKIRLPEKSILVTIDDGARAHNFIPLLEEYQVNATLFLVSSWYDTALFESPYMELASHTNNLHTPGVCPGGQGSPLKCADRNSLLEDLKKSRETLNGTKAFCFPFYEYNDYALSIIKEAGFEMGFIGGNRNVTKGINKLMIPRKPLNKFTTLEQYAKCVN